MTPIGSEGTDIPVRNGKPKCAGCGAEDELRLGFCFDCAESGERRAMNRTVLQHLRKMMRNIFRLNPNWRYDRAWAWERLTRTGDYAPGGYFEHEGWKP